MNKAILEFLEEEYDYIPVREGHYKLSETQLESLLIHMAEDCANRYRQYVFERLEPLVDCGELSCALENSINEVMDHYHGAYA
jgi:hypothetical protein